MADPKDMRLALVIEAIDRASATIEKINARVETMVKPINRVLTKMHELGEAAGLERLRERFNRVAEATEGVERAGQKLLMLEAYVGVAGGAVVEFFRKVAENDEQLEVLSRQLGMSTTEFQKYSYAALQSGVSQQAFAEGMGFLNRNIVESLRGNRQLEQVFRAVGVSWDDLRHKSPSAIMEKIADWMQKFPDKAKDSYVAMQLLGRGGREMVTFLQQGGEAIRKLGQDAQRLGLVLTPEQIENGVKFQKAFNLASLSVRTMAYSVGSELMPKVTAIVDRFNAWWAVNRQLVSERFEAFLDRIVESLPKVASAAADVASALFILLSIVNWVADKIGGWGTVLYVVAAVRIGAFIVALGKLTLAVASFGWMLLTTPLGWFLLAIGAIGFATYELIKHWQGFKAFWRDLWYGLQEMVGRAVDWMLSKLEPLLHALHLISPDTHFGVPAGGGSAPMSPAAQERIRRTIEASGLPRVVLADPRPVLGAGRASGDRGDRHQVDVSGRAQIELRVRPDGRVRVGRSQVEGPLDLSVGSGSLDFGSAW